MVYLVQVKGETKKWHCLGGQEREEDKMMKEKIEKALEKEKARSAWKPGVIQYAFEILESMEDREITEENLLNGAVDICHRLCPPSEIKKTKDGERRLDKQENWLYVQVRALYQAVQLIMEVKRKIER